MALFSFKSKGSVKRLVDLVYPVGSLYMSTNSTNPSTLFGGTWEPYAQGRCLIGAGEGDDGTTSMSFTAGGEYGKYNKTLNQSEIGDTSAGTIGNYAGTHYGVHSHTGFKSFSILNPVIGVYIWRRTA